MVRESNRLTPLAVKTLPVGLHRDGGGLYLQVSERRHTLADGQQKVSQSRSWIYRYSTVEHTADGKQRQRQHKIGLGSTERITLKQARLLAGEFNYQRQRGQDPATERKQQRQAHKAASAKRLTFQEAAEKRIKARRGEWKDGGKSEKQWTQSLKDHAYPIIGFMDVADVQTRDVQRLLEPLWQEKITTGRRVQQRIADVMQWAISMGYRDEPNPAAWRGNLANVMAKPSKVRKVKHFAAIPHAQMFDLVRKLRAREKDMAAACMLCIIWTACRSSEARGATWAEFDLTEGLWTVPGERMKGGEPHTKPLPNELVQLLKDLPRSAKTDLVFPSTRDTVISDVRIKDVLSACGFGDATIHGARSSFKSWTLDYEKNREAAEMQLSHVIGGDVESSYIRTEMMTLRRQLMQQWAQYTLAPRNTDAQVVDIKSRQAF